MREWLGPDYPLVRRLLSHESPDSLATRVVAETKLDDAAVRRQLWEGGKAAVDASRDPMIELARSLDGDLAPLRKQFEDEVEAPMAAAAVRIAAATIQGLRHPGVPGRDFHPAPELRHGAGVGAKTGRRWNPSPTSKARSIAPPAHRRSRFPTAGSR